MTSTAAVAANRKNAEHSTGPRTAEGKARSSMNALKHGLTAGDVILPNEDPEAFRARLDQWHAQFPDADATESCLIDRAAHASWRLHRCARYETARLTERVLHAVDQFDVDEHNRAEALGRRLLFEPADRFAFPPIPDAHLLDKLQRRYDDHPAVLARQLLSFAAGVRWMLDRWSEVDAALAARGYWLTADSYRAVRLMGRRPEDVLEDPTVGRLMLASHAADPRSWGLFDVVKAAALGCDSRTVHGAEVEALGKLLPDDQGWALATLREFVAGEVRRLRAWLPELEGLERLDRNGAEDRAMFDPTEAGTLARRYETASDRVLRNAIAELRALVKERRALEPAPPRPPLRPPRKTNPKPNFRPLLRLRRPTRPPHPPGPRPGRADDAGPPRRPARPPKTPPARPPEARRAAKNHPHSPRSPRAAPGSRPVRAWCSRRLPRHGRGDGPGHLAEALKTLAERRGEGVEPPGLDGGLHLTPFSSASRPPPATRPARRPPSWTPLRPGGVFACRSGIRPGNPGSSGLPRALPPVRVRAGIRGGSALS